MADVPATQTLGYSFEDEEPDITIWARLCPTLHTPKKYPTMPLLAEQVSFGRDPEKADKHIPSPQISSIHAVFERNLNYDSKAPKGSVKSSLAVITDKSTNGTFINQKKIGKNKKARVHDGDVVMFQSGSKQGKAPRPEISFIFYRNPNLNGDADETVHSRYDLRRTLGSGSFADVQLGVDRETGQKYAVKVINRAKFASKQREDKPQSITAESDLMQRVDHQNIIKVVDVFAEPEALYIVMEMANGGELFERITKSPIKHLDEDGARRVLRQILDAIMYLHDRNIAHRDLKPENILMASKDPNDWTIKITDFGLSRLVDDFEKLTTMCGTPMFLAPEVLYSKRTGGYDFSVDYWSMGVILYIMLVGHPPYKQTNGKELLQQVKYAKFYFPDKSWKRVSKQGKDLVQRLMNPDVKKRYTGRQVLKHPWMTMKIRPSKKIAVSKTLSGRKRPRKRVDDEDDCKAHGIRGLNGNNGRHKNANDEPPQKRRRREQMECDSVNIESNINDIRLDSVAGNDPLRNPGFTPKAKRGKLVNAQ